MLTPAPAPATAPGIAPPGIVPWSFPRGLLGRVAWALRPWAFPGAGAGAGAGAGVPGVRGLVAWFAGGGGGHPGVAGTGADLAAAGHALRGCCCEGWPGTCVDEVELTLDITSCVPTPCLTHTNEVYWTRQVSWAFPDELTLSLAGTEEEGSICVYTTLVPGDPDAQHELHGWTNDGCDGDNVDFARYFWPEAQRGVWVRVETATGRIIQVRMPGESEWFLGSGDRTQRVPMLEADVEPADAYVGGGWIDTDEQCGAVAAGAAHGTHRPFAISRVRVDLVGD
jgi:hypothetical protein